MYINGSKLFAVYSRKAAILDGEQYRVDDQVIRSLGIKYPVFITRTVYERYVKPPDDVDNPELEQDRLRMICNQFVLKWMRPESGVSFIKLTVMVDMRFSLELSEKWHESTRSIRIADLDCSIGATDFDDLNPCITIYMPGEER